LKVILEFADRVGRSDRTGGSTKDGMSMGESFKCEVDYYHRSTLFYVDYYFDYYLSFSFDKQIDE
jgi:hypothetical protein